MPLSPKCRACPRDSSHQGEQAPKILLHPAKPQHRDSQGSKGHLREELPGVQRSSWQDAKGPLQAPGRQHVVVLISDFMTCQEAAVPIPCSGEALRSSTQAARSDSIACIKHPMINNQDATGHCMCIYRSKQTSCITCIQNSAMIESLAVTFYMLVSSKRKGSETLPNWYQDCTSLMQPHQVVRKHS